MFLSQQYEKLYVQIYELANIFIMPPGLNQIYFYLDAFSNTILILTKDALQDEKVFCTGVETVPQLKYLFTRNSVQKLQEKLQNLNESLAHYLKEHTNSTEIQAECLDILQFMLPL